MARERDNGLCRLIGGPFDGGTMPAPPNREEFLMLTLYDVGNPDAAKNYVYHFTGDWVFAEPTAQEAARLGLRGGTYFNR